mgnify:CR=1 FL=1
MPEAPEVKWVFMVVVIGALYMSKTKSTRHLGNSKDHEEQLSAAGLEMAKHNREYYNRLTPQQKLYHNISTWWNTSDVNVGSPPPVSRVEENKRCLKHLNANKNKQGL